MLLFTNVICITNNVACVVMYLCLYYKAELSLHVSYVRLHFSKTTGRMNIKLGTIDHLPEVKAIREFMTSS